MAAVEPVPSPLLVGREDLVELARRRIDDAQGGRGELLLVSGEAGIGKSRLIAEIAALARAQGFRIARADVTPQDIDVPAAALLDLARSVERQPEFGSLGADVLAILHRVISGPPAMRRVVVGEIVDRLLDSFDRPSVLVFEDLQWADELSLEILGELTRRGRDRRLLLLATYRNEELPPDAVLRGWRARLATQRLSEEVRLRRLTREETALLTTSILGTGLPAPREVVDIVYGRTDGVPLYIEELLGAVRTDLVVGRAIETTVPETLADATLQRIGRLSPEAQAVARAGSVIGRRFVVEVLAGIMDLPPDALESPIDELVRHDVLGVEDASARGQQYDFRHQLLRDALYASVSASDRRRFHARAAEFGDRLGAASNVHASLHFERAGMYEEAFRAAVAGARAAEQLSSNREAFDLYRRAVDTMPDALPDAERARVLLGYTEAAGSLDRTELCRDLALRAREVALRAGEPLLAAEALLDVVYMGRRDVEPIPVRRDLARQAVVELEAEPPSPQRQLLLTIGLQLLAIAEQDDHHLRGARELLLEARDLAVREGLSGRAMDIDDYLAQLEILEGRVVEGLATIHAIARSDQGADYHADSAILSCYRDAPLFSIRVLDYAAAKERLTEGIAFADTLEQHFCRHVMASTEALLSWASGDWGLALVQGRQAVADPGSRTARTRAAWAIGFVAAGRGDRTLAESQLQPALAVARSAAFVDMMLPPMWGLAEAALVDGDPATAVMHCEEALSIARERGEWGLLAPFAVTGVRAHQAAGHPEAGARFLDQVVRSIEPYTVHVRPAIDHATGLVKLADGSLTAAREALEAAIHGWDTRGRRWEALWARLDLASALLRSSRFADAMAFVREVTDAAEIMGSPALLDRAAHLSRVARGRGDEVDPWHPLTTREFEVARLIAAGLTNAELAAELGITPKTASSHVEHILDKLGMSRRAEVATWVSTIAPPAAATRSAP